MSEQRPPPPSPPPPKSVAADQADVEAAARAALAERKPAWIASCWQPSAALRDQPAKVVYDMDISFDPQGVQITRGLQESREFARPDVAQCLRDQPLDLRIPPPGAPVRVILHLELP